ncbi:MAG: hypothetical protein ACVCEJ_04185 [Candidatus Izemoplasmataceae bacterium]
MENKTHVFDIDFINAVRKKRQKALFIAAISFSVLVFDIILSIVLYSSTMHLLFMIITSMLSLLVGWIIIYQFLEIIIPFNKVITMINTIKQTPSSVKVGRILDINQTYYTINGLSCNKLMILQGKKTKVYYLYYEVDKALLRTNMILHFTTYDLLITSFWERDEA